jgi:hypothetical protein
LERNGLNPDTLSDTLSNRVSNTLQDKEEEKDKEPEEEGDGKGMQGETQFPPRLDTPKFREAWGKFIDYRKRQKFKPLLPESIREKLASLAEYGPDISVIAIGETIGNGWQGIFPEKVRPQVANGHRPGMAPRSAAERDAEKTGLPEQHIPTKLL